MDQENKVELLNSWRIIFNNLNLQMIKHEEWLFIQKIIIEKENII